jgi:heme A synthase
MGAVERPGAGFRLTALAAALAAWALVAVGGVVRITRSGLGCPDWPLCKGNVVPGTRRDSIIEYSHRSTAAIVTVLVVLTAVWAWRRYRARRDVLWPALAAALLVPFQAVLGAVVVWLELPSWIVGVHFVVGLVFLAATVVTAVGAWRKRAPDAPPGLVRLVWGCALAGLALVCAGAAVVSAHADEACGREWPACNGAFVAGGIDPAIQVTHRMLAYLVLAVALVLPFAARRAGSLRRAAWLPLAACLVQVGLGIALVLTEDGTRAHKLVEGMHVAGSGVVWAAIVALAALAGPLRRAEPVNAR